MPYADPEARKAQCRRWRENNRDRVRELNREYRARYAGSPDAAPSLSSRGHTEQKRAHSKIRNAIRAGWIEQPEGLEFHHPDYSRPYFGCWVSALDHRQIHAAMIECPPCIDYEEHVNEQRKIAIKRRAQNGAIAANKIRWGT